MKAGFSLFACEKYPGQAHWRLLNALDMECYVGGHLLLVVTLGTLYFAIVVFGLPLLAYISIAQPFSKDENKEDMNSENMIETYGFLFRGYKDKFWFWEFVILVKKLALIAITVFLATADTYTQGATHSRFAYDFGFMLNFR